MHRKTSIAMSLAIVFVLISALIFALLMNIPFDGNPLCTYRDKILKDMSSRYNHRFSYIQTDYETDTALKIKLETNDEPHIICTAEFDKSNMRTIDDFNSNVIAARLAQGLSERLYTELGVQNKIYVQFISNDKTIKSTVLENENINYTLNLKPSEFAKKYADTIYITGVTPSTENETTLTELASNVCTMLSAYKIPLSIDMHIVNNFDTYNNKTNNREYTKRHSINTRYIYYSENQVIQSFIK